LGERPEVDPTGQVLAQQAVDASMSSRLLAPGDLVCPCRLVGEHGPVDDVDQVSLEDATSTAGALGRLVTGKQLLGCRVPSFLHDGGGVEDAVESAIASSV
jgi:hypothetical protein